MAIENKTKLELNDEQIERYCRHMVLPDFENNGQERLLESKVLVVGAGGLGSPILAYLGAAGIGTIGIVDDDVIDLSNLQRQIIHQSKGIGSKKVDSAKQFIENINPDVKVNNYDTRLTKDNIGSIVKEYDIVLDGTDNFPTRYLINDACYFEKKPLVSGAVLHFDGQIMLLDTPNNGPCYRCIFPEPPPANLISSCEEAGVLGVVPGVVGGIQATVAINYLLGINTFEPGKILFYNAKSLNYRSVKSPKDNECELCGDNPTIMSYVQTNYLETCNLR